MYCAAVGLQRGSRFHWCVAGVLTGWSLLGYHAAVTYIPVLGGFLVYLACFHWRSVWRSRTGLLWFAVGAASVYLPMLAQSVESTVALRAQDTVVLLGPDGSIRWDAELWTNQLVRSFGYIFRYYPDYAWGVSAGQSICMRYGSCLFGMGLVYLVLRFWAPASFVLLLMIVTCIFAGSAMLQTPPTPYHFLAAVVAIMLVSAVALDRALAPLDRWSHPVCRLVPLLSATALLAAIGTSQVGAAWQGVRRLPSKSGRPVFRADEAVIAARFVQQHPNYRHYLVRAREDASSTSPIFKFFASDSDVSDLTGRLEEVLPVPPVEPAVGASFIVLPRREADRDVLKSFYPNAREEEVQFGHHEVQSVWTYLVDAASVREAH
jgi:hypothetical protein